MTRNKSKDFLVAMGVEAANPPVEANAPTPAPAPAPATADALPSRPVAVYKKHIGGYFDRDIVEKVAILRARLDLNNSSLLRLAIEEFYKKHEAQRAFGEERAPSRAGSAGRRRGAHPAPE